MNNPEVTSPARRLYEFVGKISRAIRDERSVREILSLALEVEDDLEIIEKLLQLSALLKETTEIVQSIEGIDHEPFLRHFPRLQKALLTTSLDANARNTVAFRDGLSPLVLQSLELCAAQLGGDYREIVIPPDDLAEIDSKIGELFNSIEALDLDPELREFALDLLKTLRDAIAEYRIRGLRALEESIDVSLGKMTRYYMRAKKEKREVSWDRVQSVFDLILNIEDLMARTQSYIPAIAEFLQNTPKLPG